MKSESLALVVQPPINDFIFVVDHSHCAPKDDFHGWITAHSKRVKSPSVCLKFLRYLILIHG